MDRANAEEFYEVYKGVVKEYSVSVNAAFVLPPVPLSEATIWPRGLNTNTASRKVAKVSAVGVTISAMIIYSSVSPVGGRPAVLLDSQPHGWVSER